jgi:hypothetical protein
VLAALASAALIAAGSLAVGQLALVLCGRREGTWLAGPVGLAVLLVACGIVAGLGGTGTALAITVACLVLASAVGLGATAFRHGLSAPALAAAGLAALVAAIPFIAAGHIGILGVGLVNDDMANHLLLADWIDERFRPEPVLIDQGYPLGPHALVAGLSTLLGASSIDVFAGLVLAIPALTALAAFAALDDLRPWPRTLAAALVALPYLAAAYLAQEAFKEPIIALFVLAFALLLPRARDWRDAIPLGLIAAGVTYVYSFPGLAWLAGAAIVWGLLELVRGRANPRAAGVALGAGVAALVVLMLPELGRLADFVDFRALHPDRANEGGLGNLPGQLSVFEAFGIWPTSEFRLSAAASDLPAVLFYAGGVFAVCVMLAGLPGWVRRHGTAIPAAFAAAAVLYLLARGLGTVYTSAKALAIAAPLIALVALGGLLGARRPAFTALAAAFGIAAAGSSFLILRQAPVAPDAHAAELAEIRPHVAGEKLLFLGRDNFILYELRGSKPFTHVRNFYDPYFVEPNFELRDVGSKFDFDAVSAKTLARFPYVLTTRAAYASGPPPGYRVIEQTSSYVLWGRGDADESSRVPGERGPEPGAINDCAGSRRRGQAAVFDRAPVALDASHWSSETVESGSSATISIDLPPGRWNLSLSYDATRPVTLTAPGLDATIPGNLDYRGVAPLWPAGTVDSEGGPLEITATVSDPPLAGRLLGAHSVAHLGTLAASPAGRGYTDAASPAPGEAEKLIDGRAACGRYVDWSD